MESFPFPSSSSAVPLQGDTFPSRSLDPCRSIVSLRRDDGTGQRRTLKINRVSHIKM